MTRTLTRIAVALLLVTIVALTVVGMLKSKELRTYQSFPVGVMGTDCAIQVVAPGGNPDLARRALAAAEAELRKVESRMSVKVDWTEVSHLNAARAGEHVSLSEDSLAVLSAARQAVTDTGGAFDVTCRPIIEIWKQAGKMGQMPTAEQLAQARAQSSWDQIVLEPDGATKTADTACVDLGGLAKGYAADRAAAAMMAQGARSGIAQAGGDTRCFGTRPNGQLWHIGIRNPFAPQSQELLATLEISSGGVCTSGNYFRYTEIGGHRFSHIIDPRPGPHVGTPADAAASVTVVAPMAITADIWATALSVLGADGFRLLPADGSIQAMIVQGDVNDYQVDMTEGFAKLLVGGEEGLSLHRSSHAPASQPGSAERAEHTASSTHPSSGG